MRRFLLLGLTLFGAVAHAAPATQTATLVLYRPSAVTLVFRTPDITINGHTTCSLGEDEQATLTVPAGPVTIDAESWDAESYLKLQARPGTTYTIRVSGETLAFGAPTPEEKDIRAEQHGEGWFTLQLVRAATADRERAAMEIVECDEVLGSAGSGR